MIEINKGDFIAVIASTTGSTKAKTAEILSAASELIMNELANGNNVNLAGFGSFKIKVRAARKGRNPKTNTPVVIPPMSIPVFDPGVAMKARVIKLLRERGDEE